MLIKPAAKEQLPEEILTFLNLDLASESGGLQEHPQA